MKRALEVIRDLAFITAWVTGFELWIGRHEHPEVFQFAFIASIVVFILGLGFLWLLRARRQ